MSVCPDNVGTTYGLDMMIPMYFTHREHDAFVREVRMMWHANQTAYSVFCPACGPLANDRQFALLQAAYDRAISHRLDYGRPVPRETSPWGPSSKWGPASASS